MSTEPTRQELEALAQDVAHHLGFLWNTVKMKHDHLAVIGGLDGKSQICLYSGWNSNGRLEIRGGYPDGYYPDARNRPEMTVSIAKGARKIAADIQRRFIPKYDPLLKGILERQERDIREAGEAEEMLARIVAALEPGARTNEDRLSRLPKERNYTVRTDYGKPWAKVEISRWRKSADLEIHDCPLDLAVRICELIREEGEGGKQDES